MRKHQPDIVLTDTSNRSVANAGDKAGEKAKLQFRAMILYDRLGVSQSYRDGNRDREGISVTVYGSLLEIETDNKVCAVKDANLQRKQRCRFVLEIHSE